MSSFVHTKHSNLTNAELLAELESIRHHSPIISELCDRLEKAREGPPILHPNVTCPVCQADLLVEPDEANDRYDLKIDTH